jgi:ribosome-binding protein aMBF1 (putative translation factor)
MLTISDLIARLEAPGINFTELAAEVKVSTKTLYRIRRRESIPDIELAARILAALGAKRRAKVAGN